MADFIEFTEADGKKILVNADHIIKILQDDRGAYIYVDVISFRGDSSSIHCIHVSDSYQVVKRKLGL